MSLIHLFSSIFHFSRAYKSEMMHFRPHVDKKPKWDLEACIHFEFSIFKLNVRLTNLDTYLWFFEWVFIYHEIFSVSQESKLKTHNVRVNTLVLEQTRIKNFFICKYMHKAHKVSLPTTCHIISMFLMLQPLQRFCKC